MHETVPDAAGAREAIARYNAQVLTDWKRNLALHVVDGVFYAAGLALMQPDTILPGFVRDVVDHAPELSAYKNRLVGLLPLVATACFMMPQLLTARLAERRSLLKPPLLVFAFLERLPWLFMGFMAAWIAPGRPEIALVLFLALVFAYQFNIGLVYPVWAEFVAKTVPVRKRGLLFGIREGIGGLLGFLVLVAVRPAVSRLAYPANYAVLFFGAFAMFVVSYLPLLLLREAPAPFERATGRLSAHFGELWRTVKADRGLQRYFLCRWTYGIAQVAAPSFFALRAMAVLGAKEAAVLTVSLAMVTMLARSAVSVVIGPVGDRFGYRVILSLASLAGAASIAAALVADTAWGFYAAYALATFAHMSFWLGHGNYVLELAPIEKRPSYISLDNISGFPLLAVPFFGGWLADAFGYALPFGLGIGAALCAAALFAAFAIDPRRTMRQDLVA